jgi:ubiquinone/menaquinone biosynthesis C-methylase UbiE
MNALADYYAQRAPEYESIYQKPERQVDLAKLRALVARSFTGRRVLEIACGTGWWTEVIAATAKTIVATDISDTVLGIARRKPIDSRTVRFERCDAFELNTIEGPFDAAFAAFWWSHLKREELTLFLHQLSRRLEPGSLVMFLDNVFVQGSSTPIARRDADGNSYQRRRLADGSTVEVLKNFPSQDEVERTLKTVGDNVSVQALEYYWHAQMTTGR